MSPPPRPKRQPTPKPHEVTTAILRTADLLRRSVAATLAPHDISSQQYNVLRILRGAHPEPLPTLEVGARMLEQTPGVTRLLDKLEARGLVSRERNGDDRRLVECRITPRGRALLAELDAPVEKLNRRAVAMLEEGERRAVVRFMERMQDA